MNAVNQIPYAWPVLVLIIATSDPAIAQSPDLKVFTSQDGGFQALLLSEPSFSKSKDGSGANDFQYQYVSGTSTGVYLIAWQDSKVESDADEGAEAVYVTGRDAFRRAIQGEQVEYKKVILHGLNGRETTFRIPARSGEARSRMFLANHRWYHVLAMGTPDFVNSERTSQFLESFRLLPDKN